MKKENLSAHSHNWQEPFLTLKGGFEEYPRQLDLKKKISFKENNVVGS